MRVERTMAVSRGVALRMGGAVAVLCAACASGPQVRKHSDYDSFVRQAHVMAVLVPSVKVYEIDAANKLTLDENWSAKGRTAVTTALVEAMVARGHQAFPFEPSPESEAQYGALVAEYKAAEPAMIEKVNSKGGDFDFVLPAALPLMTSTGADSVLVATGGDQISSGGRTAAVIGKSFLAALVGGTYHTEGGKTWLVVGVVNKDGRVVYFNGWQTQSDYDLRDITSARKFVAEVVAQLPPRPAPK